MVIQLVIPSAFETEYNKDYFAGSLYRIYEDVKTLNYSGLSGKYELETLDMLREMLSASVPTLYPPLNRLEHDMDRIQIIKGEPNEN